MFSLPLRRGGLVLAALKLWFTSSLCPNVICHLVPIGLACEPSSSGTVDVLDACIIVVLIIFNTMIRDLFGHFIVHGRIHKFS